MTDLSKADISETEPSEALFSALGRLVFDFGQLEEAVRHALLSVFDGSDEARAILTGLNFRQLVERFGALYAAFEYEGSGEPGVVPLCRLLSQLNNERNREIHATWGLWAANGQPMRHRERLQGSNALSLTMETVQPEELLALAKRMRDASDVVWQVRLDFDRQRIKERRARGVLQ